MAIPNLFWDVNIPIAQVIQLQNCGFDLYQYPMVFQPPTHHSNQLRPWSNMGFGWQSNSQNTWLLYPCHILHTFHWIKQATKALFMHLFYNNDPMTVLWCLAHLLDSPRYWSKQRSRLCSKCQNTLILCCSKVPHTWKHLKQLTITLFMHLFENDKLMTVIQRHTHLSVMLWSWSNMCFGQQSKFKMH